MSNIYSISDAAFNVSSLAVQAMLYEVACYPSPGLVSVVSKGAHKDMDYYTFIDSTCALIKYLTLCVEAGISEKSPEEIFKSIRTIGINGEKDMFKKTEGVNTHKGMLFLMGICCAAVGKVIYHKDDILKVRNIIKEMTAGIVEKELYKLKKEIEMYGSVCEIEKNRRLSYGEKLYLKYNTSGIRGEVEKGLPTIFDYSLKLYRESKDLSKNHRLIHTLIGIMQHSEDSNVLHRHSMETLKEMQERSKYILDIGGMRTEAGRREISLLDKEFTIKGVSPGGSADLLAVTVFIDLAGEYIKTL